MSGRRGVPGVKGFAAGFGGGWDLWGRRWHGEGGKGGGRRDFSWAGGLKWIRRCLGGILANLAALLIVRYPMDGHAAGNS